MAINDPVIDGVVAVAGNARTHACVPPGAAIPSAHPFALPLLTALETTPNTRSAGELGFAVFHDCKNVASCPFNASKFALVPQNLPPLSAPLTRSNGSNVGLIVYRIPPPPPTRSPVPLGTGMIRLNVVIPSTVAVRAALLKGLVSAVESPIGTTNTRNAFVGFSTVAVMGVVVPGRVVKVVDPLVPAFVVHRTVTLNDAVNRVATPAGAMAAGGTTNTASAGAFKEEAAVKGATAGGVDDVVGEYAGIGLAVNGVVPLLTDRVAPVTAIDAPRAVHSGRLRYARTNVSLPRTNTG
jgi:hypothetical protein